MSSEGEGATIERFFFLNSEIFKNSDPQLWTKDCVAGGANLFIEW